MQGRNVNITEYDNEITILYKWARQLRQPAELVVLTFQESEEGGPVEKYVTAGSFIVELMNAGASLIDIAEQLITVPPESVAYLYAQVSLQNIRTGKITQEERADVDTLISTLNGFFKAINSSTIIANARGLDLDITAFNERTSRQFTEDTRRLAEFEGIEAVLNQTEAVEIGGPVNIDRIEFAVSPLFPLSEGEEFNRVPNAADGIDLFDMAVPSEFIPYIKYVGPDHNLIKLFKGKTSDNPPDYSLILPNSVKTSRVNTIYLKVWTTPNNVDKATKSAYRTAKYNLEDNQLIIRTPITPEQQDETLVLERLIQGLNLEIPQETLVELNVGGSFLLSNVEINEIALVDMVLNDPVMKHYLFVNEVGHAYAQKSRLSLRYRSVFTLANPLEEVGSGGEATSGTHIVNPSSVDVTLTQEYADSGPYIVVNVSRAKSRQVLNQFLVVFPRLISYAVANSDQVIKEYSRYLPELFAVETITPGEGETIITENTPSSSKISTNDLLKSKAPQLFRNRYARDCQSKMQPLIIDPEEVDQWSNQTFEYKGNVYPRQVMQFPPNDSTLEMPLDHPTWHFVCPQEDAPFPGLRENKSMDNREIYPFIPCCNKKDQMAKGANSLYNEYFFGQVRERTTTKETHRYKTNKLLGPGRVGELPSVITSIVSRYSEPTTTSTSTANATKKISRVGVPHTPHSLLHCVLLALDEPTYKSLPTPADKEEYVRTIRLQLSQRVEPALLKQELFDATDEEIITQLNDDTIFLDPYVHYRAIEEVYGVNIYTFTPPTKKEADTMSRLEVPRAKLFHARTYRARTSNQLTDRPVILIYKHAGSDTDKLTYPQCELIVDIPTENTYVKTFGPNLGLDLYRAISTIQAIYSWNVLNTPEGIQLEARENVFNVVDYAKLLQYRASKQIIDAYGKMRGLIFTTSTGSTNRSDEVTVFVPPSQPENLPLMSILDLGTEPPFPIVETVVKTFGQPVAVTTEGNQVTGLWYEILDIHYGIFCPVRPTTKYLDLPVGPENPIFSLGSNIIERTRLLRRTLEMVLQFIQWLYLLSGLTVEEFIENYFIMGPGTEDSLTVYDISAIGRRFPNTEDIQSLDQAVAWADNIFPGLIVENRVMLYSPKFAQAVVYQLRKFDKETKGLLVPIPTLIRRSDLGPLDFTQHPNGIIFVREADMNSWLSNVGKTARQALRIQNQLSIADGLKTEPYIYLSSLDGKIYLIQNVLEGDRYRALYVAELWQSDKINPGYQAPSILNEFADPTNLKQAYIVNGISPALDTIVVESHNVSTTTPRYLELLRYGSEQYAAMLPLL